MDATKVMDLKKSKPSQKLVLKEIPNNNFQKLKEALKLNKPNLVKPVILMLLLSLLITLGIFIFIYLRRVYSPDFILNNAVTLFINNKKTEYDADIKIFFSYNDRKENKNLSEIEEYQILKRSSSDTYEIKVTGNIDRSGDVPEGKYNLTWSKPDEKIFGFDGYFRGYDLFYKINYSYQGVVPDKLKDEYSNVNLRDLISATVFNSVSKEEFKLDINDFKFKVAEEFPDDLLENRNTHHYKAEIILPDSLKDKMANVNLDSWDVWIDKKNYSLLKLKGSIEIVNVGVEGNGMTINFEVKIKQS